MPKDTFIKLKPAKKEAITNAFLHEFSHHVYEEASITKAVKSLGIAKGSVYQYFKDKLDLYLYLKELCETVKVEYIMHLKREDYPDFWAYYRDLYAEGILFDLEHPLKSRFLYNISQNENSPALKGILKDWLVKAREMMGHMIQKEIDAGHFRNDIPVKTMAHFLVTVSSAIGDYMQTIHSADFEQNLENDQPIFGRKQRYPAPIHRRIHIASAKSIRQVNTMINVENLTFSYPSATAPTLKGLNFSIKQGEIFGFLGPSGAGKSTCQKILYKIMGNFGGSINIGGKSIKDWGREYFEQIGVGFELPNHYGKLTAKENLSLFADFYPKQNLTPVTELLEMVGLEEDANKQVDSFSKGMKMRLNFVRAIMHNPDILFFDEPTSGLDPVNAHRIKSHLLTLRDQGKTIFITTHDMATADELCERVSFIVDGEIIVTESPAKLKLEYGEDIVKVELKNGAAQNFPLEKLGGNSGFLGFIENEEVLRIHTQEATLEKVFIQVTGKALKE